MSSQYACWSALCCSTKFVHNEYVPCAEVLICGALALSWSERIEDSVHLSPALLLSIIKHAHEVHLHRYCYFWKVSLIKLPRRPVISNFAACFCKFSIRLDVWLSTPGVQIQVTLCVLLKKSRVPNWMHCLLSNNLVTPLTRSTKHSPTPARCLSL